jgi:archaellum component FlaC
MTLVGEKNRKIKTTGGVSKWWIAAIVLAALLICSAVSWALISNLAISKSNYTSEIADISDDIGHMQDTLNGLNSYASYQNNTLQAQFNDIESKILSINSDIGTSDADNSSAQNNILLDINSIQNSLASLSSSLSGVSAEAGSLNTAVNSLNSELATLQTNVASLSTAINDPTTGLKTQVNNLSSQVNNLSATVNGISGMQIVPSITATTGGGKISLAINSTQTVTSQLVAFSVTFYPQTVVVEATTSHTMDAVLAALNVTPPVTLTPGGSSGTAVAAGNINYSLYWASPDYNLGSITFLTAGTSIIKGTQTKTLAYTVTGSTTYNVVITPEFEPASNSAGITPTTTPAW